MTSALVLLAPEGAMRVAKELPTPGMPAAAAAAAASSAGVGFCSDIPTHYLLLPLSCKGFSAIVTDSDNRACSSRCYCLEHLYLQEKIPLGGYCLVLLRAAMPAAAAVLLLSTVLHCIKRIKTVSQDWQLQLCGIAVLSC
jgi:hypothetical protein